MPRLHPSIPSTDGLLAAHQGLPAVQWLKHLLVTTAVRISGFVSSLGPLFYVTAVRRVFCSLLSPCHSVKSSQGVNREEVKYMNIWRLKFCLLVTLCHYISVGNALKNAIGIKGTPWFSNMKESSSNKESENVQFRVKFLWQGAPRILRMSTAWKGMADNQRLDFWCCCRTIIYTKTWKGQKLMNWQFHSIIILALPRSLPDSKQSFINLWNNCQPLLRLRLGQWWMYICRLITEI